MQVKIQMIFRKIKLIQFNILNVLFIIQNLINCLFRIKL